MVTGSGRGMNGLFLDLDVALTERVHEFSSGMNALFF